MWKATWQFRRVPLTFDTTLHSVGKEEEEEEEGEKCQCPYASHLCYSCCCSCCCCCCSLLPWRCQQTAVEVAQCTLAKRVQLSGMPLPLPSRKQLHTGHCRFRQLHLAETAVYVAVRRHTASWRWTELGWRSCKNVQRHFAIFFGIFVQSDQKRLGSIFILCSSFCCTFSFTLIIRSAISVAYS